MSRINDLLRELRTREPNLAKDLEKEVSALADRRAFGLNFERHVPEAVELPKRAIRKGDKVRVLPPRGQNLKKSTEPLWQVIGIDRSKNQARLQSIAHLVLDSTVDAVDTNYQTKIVSLDDLVVVAEFRDPIYPGLVSTGRVDQGNDKPYHTIINGENFHALELLLFTHSGKVDCIYIDPPYNSGAKDWKYNNDYVEKEDLYRHSKWLAFMERRLKVAKKLLNPAKSTLIITIDEKEVHRLALLMEQTFPEAKVQMITTVISQNGVNREGEFSRVEEYILIARVGSSKIGKTNDNMLSSEGKGKVSRVWFNFMRTDTPREKSNGQFYPIFINPKKGVILEIGQPVRKGDKVPSYASTGEKIAIWPIMDGGKGATWGAIPQTAKSLLESGFLRVGKQDSKTQQWSIQYVRKGDQKRITSGQIEIVGRKEDNSVILEHIDVDQRENFPKTVWNRKSHEATAHGTRLNKLLIPERNFPYPKSLYAVEDTLRFFIKENPKAIILDFFSGSGTTAHAVMRLNKQDDGKRQCICVTNNEVGADEQKGLRERKLRPGDEDWEKWGICDYITKPRVRAAITGKTPEGKKIVGDYKFTDEFPMDEGFEENAEFFTLTYEAPLRVASNREFSKISPILWMRAGSTGRRIESISTGWDVANVYGVLVDFDQKNKFLKAVRANREIRIVYIITDEDRIFETISKELPAYVEPVRLYESYLRNFEIESGRGSI